MFHAELMGTLIVKVIVLHLKMCSQQNKKDALTEPLDWR